MTMEMFERQLMQSLQKKAGSSRRVSRQSIVKNNGVRVPALVVQAAEYRISPCIYTRDLYQLYLRGASVEELTDSIWRDLQEDGKEQMDFSFFADFQKVKDKLFCKVVNRERNEELLEDSPHEVWEDLAICFYYEWQQEPAAGSTVHIRKEHAKLWGVSEDEISVAAWENTLREKPARVSPLDQILQEMAGPGAEFPWEEELPLYHLSNMDNRQGAVCFLYPAIGEWLDSMVGGSFYVLPSSIHESILLPASYQVERKVLQDMVYSINRQELDPMEILSDSIYFYDSKEKKMSRLQTEEGGC